MTTRKSHDVVIVGGGIFGLSCAYACVQRNMSVLVLDAGKIGGGASGGVVGAMAPYTPDQWHPKKQYQLEALISAQSHWANVDRLSGISSGYRRIGRLTPIVDERTYRLAELRHTEAQENWKDYTWDILDDDRMIADHTAPFGVIKDTLSARIFPDHACQSLAKACENLGVEFQENMRVTGFDENIVIGAFGEISAGAIILAGGYEGFHLLDYHYGTQMGKGVKGQAALLNINLGDMPQIYADGVYIVPHENGTTAVGSTSENTWGQPFSIDEKLDEVIAKARSICPHNQRRANTTNMGRSTPQGTAARSFAW